MEVKSIYLNSIMKAYEKPAASKPSSSREAGRSGDTVTLSPEAGKRLFGAMMEQTLASAVTDRSGSQK